MIAGSVLRGVFVLGGCILFSVGFLLLNGCGGSDTPDLCDCEAGTPEYDAAFDPENLYLAEVVADEWNPQPAGRQRKNWICSAESGLAATDENGMPVQNDGALGPPEGEGVLEGGGTFTCVGIGGSAAWKFEDGRYIYNGEGIDFITFSSNFAWSTTPDSLCCELAHVEVSADGETWYKNSAEDFVPNPDPSQNNDGFAYRSVSGLHGNNPTWANWKKQMQAQKIEEVDGTEQWVDIPCECISIYFEPDDPYLGGTGFDLDSFVLKADGESKWPADGRMRYIRIIDDPVSLEAQDYDKEWCLGANLMSAMGVNVGEDG